MPVLHTAQIRSACKLFATALAADSLEALARKHRFFQRRRLVDCDALLWSLLLTVGAFSTRYISDVLRTFNSREGSALRYKPFWNRLSKRGFPLFMRALFSQLCRQLSVRVLDRRKASIADFFSEILLDDGSSFAVSDGLSRVFPGRFTNIQPAAVELHAHMSLLSNDVISVQMAPDTETERKFLPAPDALPKRSLSLRDRGYIDVGYFAALAGRDTYLICRAPKSIKPTIDRVIAGLSRRDANRCRGKTLDALPKRLMRKDLDLLVSWERPQGRVNLRLIIRYMPERKSRTLLLCNLLDTKMFDADTISQLYRLRWQIELVFKEWKSHANLHALQSENPAIVEGFIWASLCAALIKRALAHWAQLCVEDIPISTRIAALAGPQILPLLADAAANHFAARDMTVILRFLVRNAARAHPGRDARRLARFGLYFCAAPEKSVSCNDVPPRCAGRGGRAPSAVKNFGGGRRRVPKTRLTRPVRRAANDSRDGRR
jgi:hypothetical protein